MKNLFTDLWDDLRTRRLWPVALLLLAALVAVPMLLSKSAEEPAISAAPVVKPRATEDKDIRGLATVTLAQADVSRGSSLDLFDPSNPFRPPSKVLDGAQTSTGTTSGAGPGTSPPADSGGGGSSSTPGSNGQGTPGGPGSGTGPGSGGGNGGDGGSTTRTLYTYVIDVTFTVNGQARKMTGLRRLDMVPNAAAPLLIFVGTTVNGGNAVFAVDASLAPTGEGACKPSDTECAYLYLGAGSKHSFTNDDGDAYVLRIDEIRKVKAGTLVGPSSTTGAGSTGPRDRR